MDFQSACQELITQMLPQYETADTFLGRLRRGHPPVPGQVTSLLLALRVIHGGLQTASQIDRTLAQALFLAAYESRNLFESGYAANVNWPPLLDEDLARIAIAVHHVFANTPTANTPITDPSAINNSV
ncbi:MAG: Dethiobiotin synthetase [Cyanobacteria bacterium J06623_5]